MDFLLQRALSGFILFSFVDLAVHFVCEYGEWKWWVIAEELEHSGQLFMPFVCVTHTS